MFGPLGLEVSELKNAQLNWNTVNKGKRSRKSIVRNSNGLSKLSSDSPVRVVDFSGSDSEKYVETPICPQLSNESPCVPLKKRRHILWTPSSAPSHASLPNADQLSPQHQPPSDDFSGIALLAATACNNNTEEPDNAKVGDTESPSSILGRCHTLVSSMQSRDSVSCSDQKDVLQIEDKKNRCFPEASSANTIGDDNNQFVTTKFVSSEADTLHQDLCTLMEPCKENEASFNCTLKEKIHGEGIVTSDKGLVSDTEVRTICNLQESIKTRIYDGSHELDASENEDHVQLDRTQNIYEVQMDYDSPYEDGELRGPILYSCAENELEDGEHECVDYEVNGRVGDDLDSAHYPGPEGSRATEKSLGINKELDDSIENIETEGKNVPNLVDELASPMVVVKHDGSGKRKCPFDIAVSRMEEMGSKVISEKWQSCTEGWHTSGRFGKVDISRSERENRYGGSSLHKYRQTEGNRRLNHPDSRHGNHFRSRGDVHRPPRYQIGDSIGWSQENYQPEGIRQPFSRRRSPVKRFDSRGANTRSNRRERSSENCSGGYFREEYDTLVVDDVERSAYTRRVDRARGSFQKPKFSAGYEEEVDYSPRGQFLHTPPPGNRFVRETIFLTHPTRHQNSPMDMFRQDQRLSDTRTSYRRFPVASDRDELVDNCSHDTRTLYKRFPVSSNRDELVEHCNNGRQDERSRRIYGMRYSDKRRFRFEDGHCDSGKEDYNRRGQRRSFDGDYEESLLLSPSSHRSGWANEGNFVRSPSRYPRSPMGAASGRTERLGLSGQRKSNDYSTQSRRDGSFGH